MKNEINKETGLSDADVIAAAVDTIKQNGWYQGCYYRNTDKEPENCPVCGLGALSLVTIGYPVPNLSSGHEDDHDKQFKRCRDLLDAKVEGLGGKYGWADWQDGKDRTWTEVETVMLEVVADLSLQEAE